DRGGGLLHRVRGAHQHRQARRRHPRRGGGAARPRPAAPAGVRRRLRRGHHGPGHRPARPGPAGRVRGRDAETEQPAGRADDDRGGTAVRIVLAEDSVLLREGLIRLLEASGMQVVAAVADAEGLLRAAEEHRPDLVLTDVRMPPTHTDEGLRAALVLRREHPSPAVLVLSQYVEERYAAQLLSSATGGVGYLLKDRVADVAEFVDALRRVAAGGTALDPEVVAQLLLRGHSDPLDRLTPREYEVLRLMAEGRSNAGIGQALVLSEGAVGKHIGNIFAKLDLPPAEGDHRRVLAVLQFLKIRSQP